MPRRCGGGARTAGPPRATSPGPRAASPAAARSARGSSPELRSEVCSVSARRRCPLQTQKRMVTRSTRRSGPSPEMSAEVQREPHQRPQHRQRQLLLAGHPLGRSDLLRRAVEKPAVVEHHPDVGPRARTGAARGTRIDQWLMLRHLLLEERREPARLTETHAACRPPLVSRCSNLRQPNSSSAGSASAPGSRALDPHFTALTRGRFSSASSGTACTGDDFRTPTFSRSFRSTEAAISG